MIFFKTIFLRALIVGSLLALLKCSTTSKKEDTELRSDSSFTSRDSLISDSSSLVVQAALLYANDKFEEALESYSKLVELDSTNGDFFYRKAYCLAQLNRDSAAVENYLKSANLDFRKFDAYRSIGLIYTVGLNDRSKAIEYFKKCLEINPNAEEIKRLIEDIKSNPEKVSL